MEKPDSTSGCGGSDVYNTVFIDTSLDTHLAMIVSESDTVSDLKKKILYEHPLCFPNFREIKVNALKVKRKGYFYHLSDSMFVKSVFSGVSKSWFLSVDASSAEDHRENHNSVKPDIGNVVAGFSTGINNSSADVVDLLPGDTAKRLLNINDASLPQDGDDCHAKQNSASQQFGFSNSTKENSEDLCKEAEHTADSNSQVSFPATNMGSRLKLQLKDVGDDKICEDLPSSVATSVLKEKQKTKKRNKDAIHLDLKENGALVVESDKDALDSGNALEENSFQNGPSAVLNDMNLGNQIRVDETSRSLSSDRNKRSATRKRMADVGTKVPREHSECETNKHIVVSRNDQEQKSRENSLLSEPASKKKLKAEKKDGNENSLMENEEQATGPDTATSKCTSGQKLENTSAVLDHLNSESVKQNYLSTANPSGGRKKRKRQKSNLSQVGSEVSSAKDVHVDTFQAIDAIKDKESGSKADPDSFLGKCSTGGEISEPCLISPMEMQEVSEINRVPHSGAGDDDMDDTNDGYLESKNEAPQPDVASVIKTRDSYDQNSCHVDGRPTPVSQEGIDFRKEFGVSGHGNVASVIKMRDSYDQNSCHVDGHPTPVSQEGIDFRKEFGVSGHGNQSGTLEEKIVEPKKSSKKVKKSKKSKGPVGGMEAVEAVHNRGPASDESPAERPPFANGDHLSDNAEQGGTTDGKVESKTKKSDCSPSVSDVRADDVIQDVLASLKRCNNGPANAENMDKKSRKKTKKKSSTVVAPTELPGKDDVDHRDPTVLVHNVCEVSASSKSTRKTVKVNSSSAVKLNESDLGSNRNTLKPQHNGRLIQDVVSVDHPESTRVGNANNSVELPCGREMVKSQQRHEIVDLGEIIVDKATHKTVVETAVKGKKKNPKPELPSSEMLNENQCKEAKAQAVKFSSIQSQRSSSKVEPSSSNVKSSKPLLTVSVSAAKEPLRTNKSDKIDSTPKNAQRPIDTYSSRAHTDLENNNPRAVSSSALETPKNTFNLKKGGNERQSHLDIAKATGSNSRKVANSLANKKSLLATTMTIFRHDDKESSDDEYGVGNSDSGTRTPSDSSSSSDYSGNSGNGSSSQNGSYNSEGKEAGGRNKQKPGSSSPKSMSLHAILRNSSSYKKAKLTASQDLDSQTEEFVPDSQAK